MVDIQIRERLSTRHWTGIVVYIVVILGYAFVTGEILLGFLVLLYSLFVVLGVFVVYLFYRFVLAVERIADKL